MAGQRLKTAFLLRLPIGSVALLLENRTACRRASWIDIDFLRASINAPETKEVSIEIEMADSWRRR